jgi:hypothetical protein
LLVGVTDPGNSGVFIFESWIYMGISTFSNAHNFVKNFVWTSFYFEALEQTCRLHQFSGSGDKYFFSASALGQGHSILSEF